MRLLVFCVFPYAIAPPAREWNHIGSDVILAEDLERLVVWRASLVNEIVDALLPGYQFFPLLKRGLAFDYKRRQAPIGTPPSRAVPVDAHVPFL